MLHGDTREIPRSNEDRNFSLDKEEKVKGHWTSRERVVKSVHENAVTILHKRSSARRMESEIKVNGWVEVNRQSLSDPIPR